MKKWLLLIWICFQSKALLSQNGSTGIGTTTPHASSILDINSINKGVLLPRITTSQRKSIASPTAGLMVYDIEKRTIFLFDGTEWMPMLVSASNQNIPPAMVTSEELETNDGFGASVAISGNYAIIGCPLGSGSIEDQGTAYIYFRNNGVWTQQAKLTAADGAAFDRFGQSVSISGDYAVVGSPEDDIFVANPFPTTQFDRGSAYVFIRSGTSWTQQVKLLSSTSAQNIRFGNGVSIDGNRIAVGAPWENNQSGAVYLFQRSGTSWPQQQRIVAPAVTPDAEFGYSVDISGNSVIVGAPSDAYEDLYLNIGAAYIFTHGGLLWVLDETFYFGDPMNGDNFGFSVSIDDSIALVGGYAIDYSPNTNQGIVMAYKRNGAYWTQISAILIPDGVASAQTGFSVSIRGNIAVVGAPKAATPFGQNGGVYVFQYDGIYWQLLQKIMDPLPQNSQFGQAVASDGFNIVVGVRARMGGKGGVAFVNIE